MNPTPVQPSDHARSYLPLSREDLIRLRDIAVANRHEFFAKQPAPRCLALQNRVLCVALCQGAALHWLNGTNGIKDFDVWTFYAELPGVDFPCRWRVEKDFGDPKFGQSPDRPHFIGRRVDLLGRSLPAEPDADPVLALRKYLTARRTDTARHLAMKAVVILEPKELMGTVVWPQKPE